MFFFCNGYHVKKETNKERKKINKDGNVYNSCNHYGDSSNDFSGI